MAGQVGQDVAAGRIQRLIGAQEAISREILAGFPGQTEGILVEGVSARRASQLTGKSGRNISVNFSGGGEDLIGRIVPVTITGAGSNTLRGEYREEQA